MKILMILGLVLYSALGPAQALRPFSLANCSRNVAKDSFTRVRMAGGMASDLLIKETIADTLKICADKDARAEMNLDDPSIQKTVEDSVMQAAKAVFKIQDI